MYMAGIWDLYVYGRYMGPICIWPVYGIYMALTVNYYNPLNTGLTIDI